MAELTPAPSINDARTQALLVLIGRLGALDLSTLLIYRIESVIDGALPFLAWQFDVLSPLWQLVAPVAESIDALTNIDSLTDIDTLSGPGGEVPGSATSAAAQRALLEMAIPLHRYRGTPWAIRQALTSLGWTSVTILEGEALWGGTAWPAGEGWAVFRLLINLAANQPVTPGAVQEIVAAANFFKPARAWLDSVWFVVAPNLDYAPVPRDVVTLGGIAKYQLDAAPGPLDAGLRLAISEAALADGYGPIAPLYNAHYAHSGITHGAGEPVVADRALVLNGVAQLHGG
ncbi:MAG TPA: phage tail protein [Candidatus Binataceae bacterium]|nr:phage tail protein [Candidatus Binataceae bacterium]